MAIHSSILAWEITWKEEPGRATIQGAKKVEHDWARVRVHTHTHTQAGIHTQPILWSRSKLTKGRAARQARVGRRCSDVRSSASDWLWGNVCLLEKTAGQGRAEGQEMEETAKTLESNSFKGSQGWPQATGDQIYQQHKTLPPAAPEGQAGTIYGRAKEEILSNLTGQNKSVNMVNHRW